MYFLLLRDIWAMHSHRHVGVGSGDGTGAHDHDYTLGCVLMMIATQSVMKTRVAEGPIVKLNHAQSDVSHLARTNRAYRVH